MQRKNPKHRGDRRGRQTCNHAQTSSPNENWSEAFGELQSKVMRMEEIWQEKWETVQKENNSLKGRISQLETEAQKSNEMINKLKTRNDQLEAMKSQIDQTKKENQ